MKPELKAGRLALVIDSAIPENVGKCVTLLSWHPPKGDFISPDGAAGKLPGDSGGWLCTGSVACTGKMSISGKEFRHEGWGLFPSQYLMPIDGDDFQHEDDRQKELTHG